MFIARTIRLKFGPLPKMVRYRLADEKPENKNPSIADVGSVTRHANNSSFFPESSQMMSHSSKLNFDLAW